MSKGTNAALRRARLAMETWVHQYAPEFCHDDEVRLYSAVVRSEGGTLAFIARTTEMIDSALTPKGVKKRRPR